VFAFFFPILSIFEERRLRGFFPFFPLFISILQAAAATTATKNQILTSPTPYKLSQSSRHTKAGSPKNGGYE